MNDTQFWSACADAIEGIIADHPAAFAQWVARLMHHRAAFEVHTSFDPSRIEDVTHAFLPIIVCSMLNRSKSLSLKNPLNLKAKPTDVAWQKLVFTETFGQSVALAFMAIEPVLKTYLQGIAYPYTDSLIANNQSIYLFPQTQYRHGSANGNYREALELVTAAMFEPAHPAHDLKTAIAESSKRFQTITFIPSAN